MSIQIVAKVLQGDHGCPPHLRMTLIGLANHADEQGRAAYPSVRLLATYTGRSPRQVHRALRQLKALGLIVEGDPLRVAHIPVMRRPVVYDLHLPSGVTPTSSLNLSGVTPVTEWGDTGDPSGVTPTSYKPYIEPSKNPALDAYRSELAGVMENFQ